MHRYKTVAQISLILSILNLVLAAPIVVQEIHEARGDETVAAEDVPAMPNRSDELEVASDRQASLPPSPDAVASPQHSSLSDGSASSGYSVPHLSSDSSDSGYSWLLDRPPRLSLNLPVSSHESAAPHASSSGSLAIPLPASPHPSNAGPSEMSTPSWLQELEREISSSESESPRLTGSNWGTTETSDKFTLSPHSSSLSSTDWYSHELTSTPFASASGGSLSSHYFSASDGEVPSHDLIPIPEGLAPSLTPDGPPPSPPPPDVPPSSQTHTPPSPPTETPPDNAEFFNKNMMKKLGIVAGVILVGGAIASIVGPQIKHRDFQDS